MYAFGSSGECALMNLDPNMYNFVKEEFQSKEVLDILDLDKLNTQNQINGTENLSNRIDSEDFSICPQLNGFSPSRSPLEDYSFRFLHPKGDMIDPPWKTANNFTNNGNNKIPEFSENDSYSTSPSTYSDAMQNDDNTLSNGNFNISQNYNVSQWNELTKTEFVPVPLTNTRRVLNILETNDTARKIVLDSVNSKNYCYSGSSKPSLQSVKNIENINLLQSKQGNFIENEQENLGKKNVVRILLHRRKDIHSVKQNGDTVERYQVVLPAVHRSRDPLSTFKIQKEDTHQERIISECEDNTERLQKLYVTPAIKKLNFICQICGERFVTRYSLITHMKCHRQPFCSYCITLYKSREQLRSHINRLHMISAPEVTVVTSKYGRKRQVFSPLSLMKGKRAVKKR